MLRLFESAFPKGSQTSLSFMQSIIKTTSEKKTDIKIFKMFIFFISFIIFYNCTASPPILHTSGLSLLNTLLQEDKANQKESSSNIFSSSETETQEAELESEVENSPNIYIVYPRSEFFYYVGEWIEIVPLETNNIESARVVGKLPKGLDFNETTLILYGSIKFPLKKTQIKIQGKSTKKTTYLTKLYITVEEKPNFKN